MTIAVMPAINVSTPPNNPWALACRSPGTTIPTATPQLLTVKPSLVACTSEIASIAAPEGAYDYQNKYFTDEVKYHCPSGLPEKEEHEIRRIALAAYHQLGCRGWGRADLMIRASDRKPFLLEMNTSPGMTSHSLVPMSARAAGISYEALCLRVLASATLDSKAGA